MSVIRPTRLRVCAIHGPLSVHTEATAAAKCRLCGGDTGPVKYVPAEQLEGAVEERDAAYRQRDRHYLALKLAVGADAVGEWLARADAERGQS